MVPECTCNGQEIKEFFKEKFIPFDNIPEDTAKQKSICMEARASLLIEANCTGERFPGFMKCGRYTPEGWVYQFPQTWNLTLERTFGVPVPKRGLIEVAPSEFGNHGVLIPGADEALKRTMIQYSSYFAKLNTKGEAGKRVREFGCSML